MLVFSMHACGTSCRYCIHNYCGKNMRRPVRMYDNKMPPHTTHTMLRSAVYFLVLCHYGSYAGVAFYNEEDGRITENISGLGRFASANERLLHRTKDAAQPKDVFGDPQERTWSSGNSQQEIPKGPGDHKWARASQQMIAHSGEKNERDIDHQVQDGSTGGRFLSRPKRSLTVDGGKARTKRGYGKTQHEELALFLTLVKNSGSVGDTGEDCQDKNVLLSDARSLELNLTQHFYDSFSSNSSAAIYTANLLSSFYSRQRSNSSVFYNANCLYASIRNNVENYPFVSGSCVAFDGFKFSGERQLYAPCVHVDNTGALVEQDLGKIYDYTSPNANHYTEWFTRFQNPLVQPPEVRWGYLIPRLNATANGRPSNTSYAFVGESDGSWGPPYLDCNKTNRWLVTYSVPFFDDHFSFMGVVTVDVDVRSVDINQCDDGGGVYAGTHRCSNTTECVHIPGVGFQSGAYKCVCRDSFYFPHKAQRGEYFQGTDVEREYRLQQQGLPNVYGESFACLPCREGCETCTDGSPCFLENDLVLRIVVLSCQGVCILLTGLLIAVIFKYKNLKVINCDSPWMLVLVLLGAFLLYSELVAMFFPPTVVVCFMQRWLRGWGFAIAYGMLVLKIYRKLAIFQTRSATRVLVRDRDVLKWLVLIVIVLTGYLAAWTAFSVQSAQNCNVDIVTIGYADNGMKFSMCMMEWWDYVIEIIEFLFLLFGIYLCYSVRAAPSEFHETRYISIAIYNETIFSTFLYISRHILWGNVAPDWIYLMYFLRSQLTTSAMLALIFIPKIRVIHKLLHDESFRERVNSRVVYDGKWHNSFRRPNSSSSNTNNDHNFSPEDVREELKRLYTQLEVYKTKSLRIDNPHLPSKKKSNVSKWRAPRRFSRGYSLRTHSGHSESERSSEIARSNESLGKAVELHDYRVNHVDQSVDQSHCSSQKWLCQQ